MLPYSRHAFICTGQYCSPERRGTPLYRLLARLLEQHDLLFSANRVKRGETPCLGVCEGGPVMVVYPEGVWYGEVTPERLERIVTQHLRDGRPVEEAVIHRLSPPQEQGEGGPGR